jgi:hypothetical protein
MSYVVNDALDELIDLIAALLWPNGEQDREDGAKPIDLGAVSPLFQRLQIDLSDEQKRNLELRLSLGELSVKKQIVKQKRPSLCVSELIPLNNMRADGLLGKLVAQYWASARARAWYQVKCGALTWDDDTPTWSQREKQLISDGDRKKALKDPKWFGVALSNANFLDRWDGGSSKSKLWRRRYSLEATFSNWSAPPFFEWAFKGDKNFPEEGPGRWGGKIVKGGSYNAYKVVVQEKTAPVPWYAWKNTGEWDYEKHKAVYEEGKSFTSGDFGFGDMMQHLGDVYIMHGYKDYFTNFQDIGSYDNIGTGPRSHLVDLPWRTFGKHVSKEDRRAASYKFKPVLGNKERTVDAIERYYTNGYFLVRTALDIVLARGRNPQSFPGFESHCEWWGIACPDERMVKRYPDISAIGGGIVGLAGVKESEIVSYVMGITPAPGTIPPWEDKGPLWSWPDSVGNMICKDVPLQFKPRKSNNTWGNIAQFILGVEQSFCANVASGALDAGVDAVVSMAKDIAADWLSTAVEEVLATLETELGGAFWDQAKELISEVSAVGSNIARFADADKLVGQVAAAANLPTALTDYLDGVADGLPPEMIEGAKNTFETQVDNLRREWDWADDLIGSAASMGDRVKREMNSLEDKIKG